MRSTLGCQKHGYGSSSTALHTVAAPHVGSLNTFTGNTCNLGAASGACVGIWCGRCLNTVACDNYVTGGNGPVTNRGECASVPDRSAGAQRWQVEPIVREPAGRD